MHMQHDIEQAHHFLTLLDETEEQFTFQTFDDDKKRIKQRQEHNKSIGAKDSDPLAKWLHGTLDQHWETLCDLNKKRAGIFVMFNAGNGKGRNNNSVTRIRGVFNENDKGLPEGVQHPIEANIVVETSPGKTHHYFLCDGIELSEWEPIQARMIANYGSDEAAKGLSRVLRLPGFYHCKNKPFKVSIIHESGGQTYGKEALIKAFPPYINGVKKDKVIDKIDICTVDEKLVLELRSALNYLSSENYHDWIDIGQALHGLGNAGMGLWFDWSSGYAEFDRNEAITKWNSFKPDKIGYKSVFHKAQAAGWVNVAKNNKNNNDVEKEERPETQEWIPNLSSEIDYIIPFPGLARDIQQWILSASIYPQPAVAFAAALSILGVCIGRNIAYENIKGNNMFIAMAESGEGKDWPLKITEQILNAAGVTAVSSAKEGSGASITESLDQHKSMLLLIDEFGEYLSSINGKSSNQYSKEVIRIMTEVYTSCSSQFVGKKTKGNEPLKIIEPNLCVLALSTEERVFNGLSTSDLANGSLARYFILFGESGLLPRRVKRKDTIVPDHIIDGLKALIAEYDLPHFLKSKQLDVTDAYDDEKYDLAYRTKVKSNEIRKNGGDKVAFIPMYNRIAVRCVSHAMLIDQCKDIAVLRWLETLELKSIDVFMKKFLHLGSDNEDERLAKLLQAKIKESGKKGICKGDLTRLTQQIKPNIRKALIEELLDCGLISASNVIVGNSQRAKVFYYWNK